MPFGFSLNHIPNPLTGQAESSPHKLIVRVLEVIYFMHDYAINI